MDVGFLKHLAEEILGLEIKYVDLHSKYPHYDGRASLVDRTIELDMSIRSTAQERAVLAEEIAHFLLPPGADHVLYHDRRYWELPQWDRDNLSCGVSRDESASREWAADSQISDWAFQQYKNSGLHEYWEWTEHFNVPDWLLETKVGKVRAKMQESGLRPFKWRHLVRRT